jgi:hypothetical protein
MGRKERRETKRAARMTAAFDFGLESQVPSEPEIDFFFADDSRQRNPSRTGMGPLVAIGGVNVAAEEVGSISRCLDEICVSFGFPPGEEFKWSPGRELWMHSNLTGERRHEFFLAVVGLLVQKDVVAFVVIEDTQYRTATGSPTAEVDVVKMFLERVDRQCTQGESQRFVVVDRPGGDRRDEDAFLAECLETLQSGTAYVKPSHIAHNVVSTPSKLSRLLQVADFITSCTLATAAGEQQYAPAVFDTIRPLFYNDSGRIGGYGVKIHPDFRYANLYYWILHDSHFWKAACGHPMPLGERPYSRDPFIP